MKLERLQETVTKVAIIASGILIAVLLGMWAGRGDKTHITMLLGAIAYALLFFKMRQNIWLLIPLLWPLGGKLVFLPLPFSASELGILIVFASFLLLIAIKVLQFRPKYDLLDLVLLINILYSATVYVRNPVGTLAINSDRIGGKPYVDLIICIFGYWTLCRVVATPAQLTRMPYLMFIGTAFVTGLSFIAHLFPFTSPILSKIYSGVDTSAYDPEQADGNVESDAGFGEERQVYYSGISENIMRLLTSYYKPSTLVNPFHLVRFSLFLFSLISMMLTGYRSGLMKLAAMFLICCYFRERVGGFLRMVSVALVLCLILILGNGNFFNLPNSAQRALSFLPGKWDADVKAGAEGSTTWRVEMWKRAMGNSVFGSTKYIKSKLLGDGPGFDRAEFANFQLKGAGNEGQQEDLMIVGGFHSGPVSTVREVGYLGGLLFYLLMFYTAVRACKLIARTRGTPFFPMALFVGVPMIWAPFAFSFIFGAFETDFPSTILSIGFIKMIDQSLTASNLIKVSSGAKAELRSSGSRPAPAFAGRPLAGSVQA